MAGYQRKCAVISKQLVSKMEGTRLGFMNSGNARDSQAYAQMDAIQYPNRYARLAARAIAKESFAYLRDSALAGNVRPRNVCVRVGRAGGGGGFWPTRLLKSSRRDPSGACPTCPTLSKTPSPPFPFRCKPPNIYSDPGYELTHPSQACRPHMF